MFNWIRNLFRFCTHEWEIKEEHNIDIYDTWGGKQLTNHPSERRKFIVLRCKKCGDVKGKTWKY